VAEVTTSIAGASMMANKPNNRTMNDIEFIKMDQWAATLYAVDAEKLSSRTKQILPLAANKTNMENQNNSENQSAAMPCSPYPCRKTHDADWIPALFAPKDRKIMGFFEDIGWYPACWSEDKQMWCISYCTGVPDTNPEEPRWIQRLIYADDLCWWREWPNQTHPRHSEENSQADRPQGSV